MPLQLSRFIDSAAEIAAEAQGLMRALRVPPEDMRGVGITVLFLSLVHPRLCSLQLTCPANECLVQAHVLIVLAQVLECCWCAFCR